MANTLSCYKDWWLIQASSEVPELRQLSYGGIAQLQLCTMHTACLGAVVMQQNHCEKH